MGLLFPLAVAFGLFWWARKKHNLEQAPLSHHWPLLSHSALVEGNHYFFAIKFIDYDKVNPGHIRTVLATQFTNLTLMFPKAATTTPPTPRPDDWAGYLSKGYAVGFGQWAGVANGKLDPLTMAPVGADTSVPVVYWKSTEDYLKNTIDAVTK
jgi:hypothetical protein